MGGGHFYHFASPGAIGYHSPRQPSFLFIVTGLSIKDALLPMVSELDSIQALIGKSLFEKFFYLAIPLLGGKTSRFANGHSRYC